MDAPKKKKQRKERGLAHQTDLFLKKHVGLIHCENKLSLMQRKICNILLFNALDHINDKEIHELSLRKLCSLIGFNSNDIQLIKQSIKSLISIVMEWNLLEDSKFLNTEPYSEDAVSWHASALLAGASIKQGVISYSYSPQIKTVLSSLELYGRINLFVQAKFNSAYSLALYENCSRFKNLKQTAWFSIQLFRLLMGVTQHVYPEFKEFKRNVISIAVKEVNQKSDIYIEPQFKKKGNKITEIQFLLKENDNYHPTFKKPAFLEIEDNLLLQTLMRDFKLSDKQAREVSVNYTRDFVLDKIRLIQSKKHIAHPGAYLLTALKHNYPAPPKAVVENTYLREAGVASEIQSLKKKYMLYKVQHYTQRLQKEDAKKREIIQEHFEKSLEQQNEILRVYKKSGLSSPFVMSYFIECIEKHFPELTKACLSFDDYITADDIECELSEG